MEVERDIFVLGGYQFVNMGQELTVPINVDDMTEMRSTTIDVRYDPNALQLENISLGDMFEVGDVQTPIVGKWNVVTNFGHEKFRPGRVRIVAYSPQGTLVGPQELILVRFRGITIIDDPQTYTPVRVDAVLSIGDTQKDTVMLFRRITTAIKVQRVRRQHRQPLSYPGEDTLEGT